MFFCYSVRLVTNSSFEIAAHIAVHDRFSKGITLVVLPILFSCQGTDVREGRLECQTPHVRVKRNISCCQKKLRSTRRVRFGWKRTLCREKITTSAWIRLFPKVLQRTGFLLGT